MFIVTLAVSLQLVFEYRENLPKSSVGKVLDDVLSSVVGAGKASEARFEHEEKHVKEKLRGLKADMEGAEQGVKDGLKKEVGCYANLCHS